MFTESLSKISNHNLQYTYEGIIPMANSQYAIQRPITTVAPPAMPSQDANKA